MRQKQIDKLRVAVVAAPLSINGKPCTIADAAAVISALDGTNLRQIPMAHDKAAWFIL